MTESTKVIFQDLTTTLTETSNRDNQAITALNGKSFELMNEKGMIAPYLASSSVNLFKLENRSQFIYKKDPSSIRMKDFW